MWKSTLERGIMSTIMKYAQWEESQKDLARASRGGLTTGTTPRGSEMEMRNRFVNHARNVWDRAVTLLPRLDQLWYKYIHVEKRYRQRYMYFWINYALYEELEARDVYTHTSILRSPREELERTRGCLDRTKHLKVCHVPQDKNDEDLAEEDNEDSRQEEKKRCLQRARRVFEKAIGYFRTSAPELKERREGYAVGGVAQHRGRFRRELGDVSIVRSKLPKKLKKRRQIVTEDGPAGYEEFFDYLFPEETQTTNLKIRKLRTSGRKQKMMSAEDD